MRRAQEAVRALKQREPRRARAIVVRVEGGTYFLDAPLVFGPEDAGTEAAPIIYEGAPGARSVLSGGRAISGFRVGADGRWRVTLPDVAAGKWSFAQLYVNDQRRFRPHLPQSGFFKVEGELGPSAKNEGKGHDRFTFAAGDLKKSWTALEDVEVLAFHVWTASRLRIASIDEAARTVTFTGATRGLARWTAFTAGNRYRVENVREALTSPGQFYLQRRTGELVYVPRPGEAPGRASVVAPRLPHLLRLIGDVPGRRFVAHLHFRGLTFAHTSWVAPPEGQSNPQAEVNIDGAVVALGARDVVFERCAVRHTGGYAFAFGPGSRGNRIESCELVDLGAGGVKIGAAGPKSGWGDLAIAPDDAEAKVSHHVVRDNTIAHGGRIHTAAVGVWIGHASENVIEHNDIYDFYYTGVSLGWVWGFKPSAATSNRIAWNHIHTIGQALLSDMGGIYSLGVSPGTVIEGNHIHDVDSFSYGGWGLYTDEGSSFITLRNNLVYRTKDGGFDQHYGRANLVENNIFAFGRECLIRRNDRKDQHSSFTFARNLVFSDKPKLLCGGWQGGPESTFALDENLYWVKGGTAPEFDGKPLEAWRARGQDQRSLVADPMFVDPEAGDFRLKAGSPAFKLGFEPWDFTRAGRRTVRTLTQDLPAVPSLPVGRERSE